MRRPRPHSAIQLPPVPPLDPARARAGATAGPAIAAAPEPATDHRAAPALRPRAHWERVARIAAVLDQADKRAAGLLAGATYPLAAYDQFRRDHAIPPPPGDLPGAGGLVAVVDAGVAAPFLVRETLRSLQEQTVRDWRAVVVAPPELRAHPVGSFADIDPRIGFVDPAAFAPRSTPCLWLAAGVVLDPQALAWFAFAAARTGAAVVFADHDHGVHDPDLGALRADPWLFGAYDAIAAEWQPAPAALWTAPALSATAAPRFNGSEEARRALLSAAGGLVAHVPRLLATEIELPINARGGRADPDDDRPGRFGPVPPSIQPRPIGRHEGRIAVVMPTRDAADLVERAVASLRATARDPARLEIIVVDNRSTQPETGALLSRLEAEGAARRLAFDRAFNWGLVNNEGAGASDAPFLVFANNDIEMLSRGWDDAVIAGLETPGVGALGARLLYPNRTVQHAGIVFGMVPGHTEHEGRGVAASDPGPQRRLVTPRSVGGVTGAFLAMSRALWAELGGIDVTMGVAHSDIDLCLRVRERGRTILYEPRIEAIHFESITRGMNVTKAQVAWDESERGDLVARWGEAMIEDVGVSPYWARTGVPFETLREPSQREIVRHIDRTGRAEPWRPSRREEQRAAAWRAEALG